MQKMLNLNVLLCFKCAIEVNPRNNGSVSTIGGFALALSCQMGNIRHN